MSGQPILNKSFLGSRLKIERANRHINELNHVFKSFLNSDFCKLHIELDANTGENLLKLDSIANAPLDASLVIGDAVHNLRSAFDYVTTFFIGKDNDRISFPVGDKREDLIASKNFRAIQAAFPDLAIFIRDQIQPYSGGNFYVWEIGQLDNIDKHKLLVAVTSIQALRGVCAEDENRNKFVNMTFIINEGGVLNAVGVPGKMKITSYGKPSANILFPNGTLFENQPVIPTLINLKAIEALELFCFGAISNPNAVPL
jgi:hypothetical protein